MLEIQRIDELEAELNKHQNAKPRNFMNLYKLGLTVLLAATSLTTGIWANHFHIGTGRAYFSRETVNRIDNVGAVSLEGTTVTDFAKIVGNFTANEAYIESLDVVGNVNMTNSIVNRHASLIGGIKMTNSEFKSPITICSDKAVFSNCTLDAIRVLKSNTSFAGPQVIYLDNTIIKGSVAFEGNNGKIVLDSNSKVTGPVEGLMEK